MSSSSATMAAPQPTSASCPASRIPTGMHTVTPHLVCAGAAAAMEFYKKAFGAAEIIRVPGPDGRLWHGCIKIGDSAVMVVDEFPEMGSRGPKALGGTAVTIHLYVDDADVSFAHAVNSGCKVIMPLADMFWGDRYGLLEDPFGHNWSIATHLRDMCEEEIVKAAQEFTGGCGQG